ncbi:MAG: Gfo/Idh/MocA family oxidoreductase [Verrucomicrobia bacterium]|nr:Gfo/Idh/MocA family oxidoreductase [Verrucomicrobiota bacterium]
MKQTTRRDFLKTSLAAGAAIGLPRLTIRGANPSANDVVRLAVIGLGGTTTVGGVGGRGHQLIGSLRGVPGARITALCDVDQDFLDREVQPFKNRGEEIRTYTDLRKVLDDKTIDAVVVATPNHWHALATVWACQAGKDVYVEKPFSHNIWEGRQMVAAARKYGRMVQVGTQNRSSSLLGKTFESLRGGKLGPIRYAHALVYRPRESIGKVSSPTPVPSGVDYDLWCGPAPKVPLMRNQLHYEWHWFWATGNGEIGNNGIHVIDICRWALGQNQPPPRALSIGGRFAFDDCGETANTHIAMFDYQPAPLICEVRNVRTATGADAIGKFRNQNSGIVIDCEGGYFAGNASGGNLFDKQGKKIEEIADNGESRVLEVSHLSNFVTAVRNRNADDLVAEALQGHLSAACCHMANISYRLGKQSAPDAIRETIKSNSELSDALERCGQHLRENGVDLGATRAALGPWVTFDSKRERFVRDFADQANEFLKRDYRPPFVVPNLA